MSEFEAYDIATNCWEVFHITKLDEVRRDPRYRSIVLSLERL